MVSEVNEIDINPEDQESSTLNNSSHLQFNECDFTQIEEYYSNEVKKEVIKQEIGPNMKIDNCKLAVFRSVNLTTFACEQSPALDPTFAFQSSPVKCSHKTQKIC